MDDIFTREMIVPSIIVAIVTAAIVIFIFFLLEKNKTKKGLSKIKNAEEEAERLKNEARNKASEIVRIAEAERKEKVILAKEEIQKERGDLEGEIRERRAEVAKQEKRLLQKEETLDKKIEKLEGKEIELLDSPGILWPKIDVGDVAFNLATFTAIKEEVLPIYDVCEYALRKLNELYPDILKERYGINSVNDDFIETLEIIGKKRGCLIKGGEIDYDKVINLIMLDIKQGVIRGVTFDRL